MLTASLLNFVNSTEDVDYDDQGLVTPLEMVSPEERAAWKEEYLITLLRDYGMTEAEAQNHIAFVHNLEL